jgi:hypothetical protein
VDDAMPVFSSLVLAFDLLEASSGCDAIEDILDLSRGDMPFTDSWEKPAF